MSMYGIVDEGRFFGFVAEYCIHGSMYLCRNMSNNKFNLNPFRNMKFRAGISLGGKLAVEFARNIAGAIANLHTKRIAHRDIKSANIMVSSNTHALRAFSLTLARLMGDTG